MFLVAVTLSVIGQMFVIYCPPLQRIFQTEALTAKGSFMHSNDKGRSIQAVQRFYFSLYRSFIPGSVDIECLRNQRNKEIHRETVAKTSRQQPVL